MMRLTRPACSAAHTARRAAVLTERFRADPTAPVWKQHYFVAALLNMSFDKCAYCEADVTRQAIYMEIDHAFPKALYPERVVDWANLLPACKHCNMGKGDHDVGAAPTVDPSAAEPRLHLQFDHYRFHALDEIGQRTIGVLRLNDLKRKTTPRFLAGEKTYDGIRIAAQDLLIYEADRRTENRNAVLQSLDQLLREAGPAAEYGSTAATILIASRDFADLKQRVEAHHLWNAELDALLREAAAIAYSPRP